MPTCPGFNVSNNAILSCRKCKKSSFIFPVSCWYTLCAFKATCEITQNVGQHDQCQPYLYCRFIPLMVLKLQFHLHQRFQLVPSELYDTFASQVGGGGGLQLAYKTAFPFSNFTFISSFA